jgi:hypothetical protein
MSAAGGWWCATAMLASVNLHQADRIIGAITAAPTLRVGEDRNKLLD